MLRPLLNLAIASLFVWSALASMAGEREKCMVDWFRRSDMVYPVTMYRVQGGFSLEGEGREPVLLTENFFKNSKIQVPRDAEPVQGSAYRYALDTGMGAGKGGGRDTLIDQEGNSEKGTGGNSYFSPDFDPKDFRSNGLQAAGDVLFRLPSTDNERSPDVQHAGGGISEYITFKNLSKLGVSVVEPTHAAILPEPFQLGLRGKHKNYNLIAMKVRRNIADPVQIAVAKAPKKAKIIKLASDFYFYSVSDGAINSTNVTADAKIKDPGHVGFGYPILSSAYRCTTCTHEMGSSHDGQYIGILDYYFRGKKFKPESKKLKSYSHVKFSQTEATDFTQALLGHLNSKPFKSKLTGKNIGWLYDLTRERFLIEPRGLGNEYSNRTRAVLQTQQAMLGLKVEKNYPRLEYKPDRPSLSMRFVLQLAALRSELGKKKFGAALKHASGWLVGDKTDSRSSALARRKEFVEMTEWFADLLEEKKVSSGDLGPLFKEFMPQSEIESAMSKRLDTAGSFDNAVSQIRQTVRQFSEPVVISPERFYHYIMDLDLDQLKL